MAKNGERLLVKAKRRKIKENVTIDESIGVSEFSSKIKKKDGAQKAKNGERLLVKAKRRKIKENTTIDESIGGLEFSSKIKNKAGAQKAKNGERLSVEAKRRKIKENATIDESIGVLKFSSKIKKKAGAHKELKRRKLDQLKNNNKTSIKKKQKKAMMGGGDGAMIEQLSHDDEHTVEGIGSGRLTNVDNSERSNCQTLNEIDSSIEPLVAASESKIRTKKVTKDFKYRNKCHSITGKASNTEDTQGEVGVNKVDEIPLVDEDCTRGMKKWLIRYKESRPGLKVLQQRIDEFVTAHEEQQEQERKEREAHASEGGWTVVVHHKGRKKTTDIESGTTVGSVAPAAVMDKMSKKKKNIMIDFYRFQKKEAKRNELMMLQSKFEQDKKRIQQLRATRKFKPY